MERITRFGVSVESELLKNFDRFIAKMGYANRSEALRDLIRNRMVDEEWKDPKKETIGVLSLVYNHEKRDLTETLNGIQHRHLQVIVSSTHIHIDDHNCLEVVILKGKSSIIKSIADKLLSTRSVKHGRLMTTTTGKKII